MISIIVSLREFATDKFYFIGIEELKVL